MVHSCAFRFLVITMYILTCLCAYAEISEHTAREAVRKVKQLTQKAWKTAKADYTKAEYAKDTVEARKLKAVKAASDSEKAAKDTAEAKAIAHEAKNALDELIKIYSSAQEKAQKAVKFTNDLMSKAYVLDGKSKIQISPDGGLGNDYSKVSKSAAEVKKATEELEEEIQKSKPLLNDADSLMVKVSEHAKNAQMAKHHVDAVVTVAKMKSLLCEADADIAIIQRKSEEIKTIVQEIERHLNSTRGELMLIINGFHTKADSYLRRVKDLIKEVQATKQVLLQEKAHADKVLTEIPNLTVEREVRQKAESVVYYSRNAAAKINTIKTALQNSKSYAENSNQQKQETLKALLTHKSKSVTVEDMGTNKPSLTVEDATTKTTSEETKEQKDANPGQPFEDTTTKGTSEDPKKEKGTNPGQYVGKSAKSSGIKGDFSPYEIYNDSAITASFSLLLALIVCAALN